MTRKDFLEQVTGEGIGDRPDSPGYLVEYPDGYQSWNVSTEFEKISRVITDDEYRSFFGVESDGSLDENGFQWYIQTKVVNAEFMGRGTYEGNPDTHELQEAGYKVIYPNGHESWSPFVKFEEAYRELTEAEYHSVINPFNNGQ